MSSSQKFQSDSYCVGGIIYEKNKTRELYEIKKVDM